MLATRDGGFHFTQLPGGGLDIRDVAVSPVDGRLHVATDRGVYALCDGVLTAVEDARPLPADFAMSPNFPNPFNAGTVLPFQLRTRGEVRLEIYNVAGQRVRRLLTESLLAGPHRVRWDGRDDTGNAVATGVYLAVLRGPGGSRVTQRLLLLK